MFLIHIFLVGQRSANTVNFLDYFVFFDCEGVIQLDKFLACILLYINSTLFYRFHFSLNHVANVKSTTLAVPFDMLLDTGVNEIVLGKIMQILVILLPYLFYGRLSKLNQLVFEP